MQLLSRLLPYLLTPFSLTDYFPYSSIGSYAFDGNTYLVLACYEGTSSPTLGTYPFGSSYTNGFSMCSEPAASPTHYPTQLPSVSSVNESISIITTVAGTGSAGYSGDNSDATSATINGPHGVVIDSEGNIYFAEWSNNCVRKITASTGIISTIAGTGSAGYSGDGGLASSAELNIPNGLCIDTAGTNMK